MNCVPCMCVWLWLCIGIRMKYEINTRISTSTEYKYVVIWEQTEIIAARLPDGGNDDIGADDYAVIVVNYTVCFRLFVCKIKSIVFFTFAIICGDGSTLSLTERITYFIFRLWSCCRSCWISYTRSVSYLLQKVWNS